MLTEDVILRIISIGPINAFSLWNAKNSLIWLNLFFNWNVTARFLICRCTSKLFVKLNDQKKKLHLSNYFSEISVLAFDNIFLLMLFGSIENTRHIEEKDRKRTTTKLKKKRIKIKKWIELFWQKYSETLSSSNDSLKIVFFFTFHDFRIQYRNLSFLFVFNVCFFLIFGFHLLYKKISYRNAHILSFHCCSYVSKTLKHCY